jgi:hypothetical protein
LLVFENFRAKFVDNPAKSLDYFFKLQLMGIKNLKTFIAQLPSAENIVDSAEKIVKLQHGLQILQRTDLRSLMQKINLPNLHIYGKQDRLVPDKVSA